AARAILTLFGRATPNWNRLRMASFKRRSAYQASRRSSPSPVGSALYRNTTLGMPSGCEKLKACWQRFQDSILSATTCTGYRPAIASKRRTVWPERLPGCFNNSRGSYQSYGRQSKIDLSPCLQRFPRGVSVIYGGDESPVGLVILNDLFYNTGCETDGPDTVASR